MRMKQEMMMTLAVKDINLAVDKRTTWKNSLLNGIRSDTAVLVQRFNQLNFQANWERIVCEFVVIP